MDELKKELENLKFRVTALENARIKEKRRKLIIGLLIVIITIIFTIIYFYIMGSAIGQMTELIG